MADDPRKLRKLLEILNENNVTSYKDGDLEILIERKIEVSPVVSASSYSIDEFGEPEAQKSNGSGEKMTDDQWLLYSADGGAA